MPSCFGCHLLWLAKSKGFALVTVYEMIVVLPNSNRVPAMFNRVANEIWHDPSHPWGVEYFGARSHVQRTMEEENGRTDRARVGARLERAIAVRWKNIVLREWMQWPTDKAWRSGREGVWRLR